MRWFYAARVAIRSFFARGAADDQLRADLRFHIDEATTEYIEQGLSPDEARSAALRAFGHPVQVIEEVRDMSVWTWWERLTQDLPYGVRGCRRSPAFAATAVLSLALGIGANTAIFGVIDAALLRPLPLPHPERLVLISSPKIGDFTYPDYVALRAGTRAFSDIVAASSTQRVSVGVGSDTEQASVKVVSGNYFTGLGVSPGAGRLFTSDDETAPFAVISQGYWNRRFGGASTLPGQQIRLDGTPFTIVGVAPVGFFGEAPGESPDIWTSVALLPPEMRSAPGFSWLHLVGRLRPGATLPEAQADVQGGMTSRHPTASPDDTAFRQVDVVPGARGLPRLRERFADPLRVLMAIVGLVLLIACTNLGSLLVARGAARQGEIATRLALGASRARIVRQLMTESLLLAITGGALGLVFAAWGTGALLRLASGAAGGLSLDVGIDQRMLLFTVVVSLAAGGIFGLTPALRAVRHAASAPVAGLGEGGQRTVGRQRRWSARDAFIIAQVALSLVLLAGSAMFIRTLRNLEGQDLGFSLQDRLQVQVARERGHRPVVGTLVPSLLSRVTAIPGVQSASVALNGVLGESSSGVNGLQIDGYTPRDAQDQRARADWVGPDYFRTVGIPLVAGREFTFSDVAGAQRVAVVNDTMARHYFKGGAALGRRFQFNKQEYQIVGVARDAKYTDLRAATPRVVYFPVLHGGGGPTMLEIRASAGDPAAIVAAVRSAIREVDPRLSAGDVLTPSQRMDQKLGRERLVADLAVFFGGLTLLLVSIGVYGTLAYTAARRTREIGVRLALGSGRGAVVWIMMRDIVVRLGVGLVLGAIGVLSGGRLVGSMLFGLAPNDVSTIAIAVALLSVVALVAGSVTTLRASRLDPASVLRE